MRFIAFCLIALSLTSCGYQGYTRYPCQEAKNWDNPECNPPICKATGTCTIDLLPEVFSEKQAINK